MSEVDFAPRLENQRRVIERRLGTRHPPRRVSHKLFTFTITQSLAKQLLVLESLASPAPQPTK